MTTRPQETLPSRPTDEERDGSNNLRESALSPPSSQTDNERLDWDVIHAALQTCFAGMAAAIHQRWPMIRSTAGRTSGRAFWLFSYCTFNLSTDQGIDPVVVGLTFHPAASGRGVVVQGDVSGEENGRVYFALAELEVPNTQAAVLAVAREYAEKLGQQVDVVVQNLVTRKTAADK